MHLHKPPAPNRVVLTQRTRTRAAERFNAGAKTSATCVPDFFWAWKQKKNNSSFQMMHICIKSCVLCAWARRPFVVLPAVRVHPQWMISLCEVHVWTAFIFSLPTPKLVSRQKTFLPGFVTLSEASVLFCGFHEPQNSLFMQTEVFSK